MPEVGISGLIVILVVALLLFGPKRLPEIGRSLGNGMREFKDSISGANEADSQPELPLVQGDATVQVSARPVGLVCAGCGVEARADDRFCSHCGASLEHASQTASG